MDDNRRGLLTPSAGLPEAELNDAAFEGAYAEGVDPVAVGSPSTFLNHVSNFFTNFQFFFFNSTAARYC